MSIGSRTRMLNAITSARTALRPLFEFAQLAGRNTSSNPMAFGAARLGDGAPLCLSRVASAVLLLFGFLGNASVDPARAEEPLFVYCCAGFRPPIEDAARAFSEEHGVRIDVTYAGSGCLIAQAELAGRGDLFIPGEEHYLTKAQERGLVGEITRIAYLRPVIAVRNGNPHGIRELADLARPGLRVGLGDPKSVAVGMASDRWLEAALPRETIDAILKNTTTRAINVNELGTQVVLGGIDAAIVWDVTVTLFADLEAIVPPESRDHRTVITGSVLEMSANPERAHSFLRFLTGPEGQAILAAQGYEPFGEGFSITKVEERP